MKNKGVLFTIDGLLAIIFIAILIFIFSIGTSNNYSKQIQTIENTQKISDLLITTQYLEITNILELEENYIKLFKNKKGYIIINNMEKKVGNTSKTQNLISQSIRYINSSNKEIYIEIGVYD